ncbi:hypothetical protein O7627_02655 [Solwaraspora sp. WMMD1047]|jgi:hypothetical protein|uniref:hypothetical protein n=1 Tax=Solwaraspora sp. WMMD1047 TaxID=3016102 RepID=UPI002416C841|nr:hypothetical protein [Solwaraspora sp. WMMD1047]MDG4828204.1 hypothetical protein [Solwaraspora sp. WMMD1047]
MVPKPGDVLLIDGRASVQFAGDRALRLRVIWVCERPTYRGWCWVTGYCLDADGNASERREVFVRVAGLQKLLPRGRAGRPVQPWANRKVRTRGV